MQPTTAVSRPAWVSAMNALTGTGGTARKSPVEIVPDAASVVPHSHYAEVTGVRSGKLGRWTDGVAAMRADRATFASYWAAHNDQVRRERETDAEASADPLWVVLGDSTGQGLGAPGPNSLRSSAPAKLFAALRELLKAVPDNPVLPDLPLLSGFWGIVGRISVP